MHCNVQRIYFDDQGKALDAWMLTISIYTFLKGCVCVREMRGEGRKGKRERKRVTDIYQ